jgi:hypothetical protein
MAQLIFQEIKIIRSICTGTATAMENGLNVHEF